MKGLGDGGERKGHCVWTQTVDIGISLHSIASYHIELKPTVFCN